MRAQPGGTSTRFLTRASLASLDLHFFDMGGHGSGRYRWFYKWFGWMVREYGVRWLHDGSTMVLMVYES
jgi:hypothetical protein